jgi:hypothetical protein
LRLLRQVGGRFKPVRGGSNPPVKPHSLVP